MTGTRSGPYTPREDQDPAVLVIRNAVEAGISDLADAGSTPANHQQVITGPTPRSITHNMDNSAPQQGASRFETPPGLEQPLGALEQQHLASPLAQQLGISDHHLAQLRNLVYQDVVNEQQENLKLVQNNTKLVQNNNLMQKQDVLSVHNSPTNHVQINQIYQTILTTAEPDLPPPPDDDMGQSDDQKREAAIAEERRKSLQIATDRFGPQKLPLSVTPFSYFSNTEDCIRYLEQKCKSAFPPIGYGVCPVFIQIQLVEHLMEKFLENDKRIFA